MRRLFVIVYYQFLVLALFSCRTAIGETNDEKYVRGSEYHQEGLRAFQTHEYDKAKDYFKKSLDLCLGINECISSNYAHLGDVYREIGFYSAAIDSYEYSLKIYRDDPDLKKDVAITLNNLGLCYLAIGDYIEALKYLQESLEIRKEMKEPELIANVLLNIGAAYSGLGDYEKAISSLKESMKISKEHNLKDIIPVLLFGLGSIYTDIGQYEMALQYLNEAIDESKRHNNFQALAKSWHNIAAVYEDMGLNDQAIEYYKKALKIKRDNKISPYSIAGSLDNLGGLYLSMRDYEEAEKFFTEAEKEMESSGYDSAKVNFVELYLSKGEYSEALKLLRIMAPHYQDSGNNRERMQYYTQFGLALKGSGDLKTASVEFLKAVISSEEMRSKIKADKSSYLNSGIFGGRLRAYKGLVASLAERALKGEKTDKEFASYGLDIASNAFYFAEMTKARTLLEAMADAAKKYSKEEISTDIRDKEQDLLNQLSAIENLWEETYRKGAPAAFKELTQRKEKLKKEFDALVAKIRKEYPMYAALNYSRPIPPDELPLKANEVLLEYVVSDDASYVFRVSKGKVEKMIKINMGKEEINKMVTEFVLPLQIPSMRDHFSPSMGKKLYDFLLDDALRGVSPEKDIIIVGDGKLGALPFEVLVVKTGKDLNDTFFVADKWRISYYQSATVMALNRMLKPTNATKPLFALGNPVYNTSDFRYLAYKQGKSKPVFIASSSDKFALKGMATRGEWGKVTKDDKGADEIVYTPLPETEDEVKAIAYLFGVKPIPPDVLLNMDANETKLRTVRLKDYRYIHFATHADLPGKLQGINEPFILLGQVENKPGDNGFLTLSEVLGMKLDADMVVLSACLTGRGKVIEGEGVVNFARAFHHAGARSVLVSLWEVASDETVEYMKIFYQHLKDGKSKAEALSLARSEIKKKYPNPFYWAPFILHGEG